MTNLLLNPDFQESDFVDADGKPHWNVDEFGNQTPPHWTRTFWRPGELLPHPTKNFYNFETQRREQTSAICGAIPEDVHKLAAQLPDDEQAGQPRQLIFPNRDKVYKRFGAQGAIAGTLEQTIKAPPKAILKFTAYVLVDAPDKPSAPYGLEDDHAIAWLRIFGENTVYDYRYLSTHFDIVDVNRPWCKLTCIGGANSDGEAVVTIGCQKNWPGPTAFFFGPTSVEIESFQPPPNANEELEEFKAEQRKAIDLILSIAGDMRDKTNPTSGGVG